MIDILRQRLTQQPQHSSTNGDHVVAGLAAEDRELTAAAVLVPVVNRPSGLTVLLTQRTDHLEHHPGQVSFPGGRKESDDRDAMATALRETEEEVGLHRDHIEIIGIMQQYQTSTGFLVTPVVGVVTPPFETNADPFEVAEIFEVPLDFILDSRNHQRGRRMFRGRQRHFYVLPYKDYYIWGATAAMLVSFARLLNEPQLGSLGAASSGNAAR